MRIADGDYGSKEERPLTMPDYNKGIPDLTKVDWNGNNDPTVDKTLVRPMDMRATESKGSKSEGEIRKEYPLYSGLLKYFPDALAAVAHLSKVGNDQHNPGEPLHWVREKSTDQLDALLRHLKDHSQNPFDTDGERHLTKVVWRGLAELQLAIEAEQGKVEKHPAGFVHHV